MNQTNSKPNQKIITQRAGSVKGIVYNILGGLSLWDILVLAVFCIIGGIFLVLFAKINIWLGVAIFIIVALTGVVMVIPVANKHKVYQHLWKQLRFLVNYKKLNENEIRMLNPVKTISKEGVTFVNNTVACFYYVKTTDLSLLQAHERKIPIGKFYDVIKNLNLACNLFVINQKRDLTKQLRHLQTINHNNQAIADHKLKVNRQKQINNFVDQYETLLDNEQEEHKVWVLTVYGSSFADVARKTQFVLSPFQKEISFHKVKAEHIKHIVTSVNLQRPHHNLKNVIRKSRYLKIDNKFYAVRSCSDFPLLVGDAWLYNLANLPGVKLYIKINNLSEYDAIKKLDKAIIKAEGMDSKKASHTIETRFYLQNFHTLLDMIKSHGEGMKMLRLYFMIEADTLQALEDQDQILRTEMAKNNFRYDSLQFEQLASFYNCLAPLSGTVIDNGQEISHDTLSSMWPFSPNGLNDSQALYLGRDQFNNPIFFDVKKRNNQRTNSNCMILGMTGFGKTYHVSKQINWLILNDVNVFIIDPEREYHELAHYYNGYIIAIGKDKNSKLNPLEIFGDNLMEHINFIEQFFRILYKDLDDYIFGYWQQIMLETYQSKNITSTTDLSKLKPTDYPILSDLYETCLQWCRQNKIKNENFKLKSILWKLANGSDGHLWNQHTTLNIHQNYEITIFDIHELTENENIKNAQLFLMLSFLNKKIKNNKIINNTTNQKKWIAIVVDEAHLLVNENNNLALNFLFQMTKRIRKYNGILYIISQNVNDFVGNERIKTQTQGIINNCSYMFIHHLAPHDLKDLNELLKMAGPLNEHQKMCVSNAEQGTCLFINHNNRSIVNVTTFKTEDTAWINKSQSNNI